ncbi:MAG: hypothetical protein JXR96_08420 [Deltaproteobacteria bacterium]|nr:hypothetical protein [Deltaproteobacteria bacterium]
MRTVETGKWLALAAAFFLLVPGRLLAGPGEAADAYQRGMYLQVSAGDLDGALEAYGAALAHASSAELRNAILLRMSECLRWQGREQEVPALLARLDASRAGSLGAAASFPRDLDLLLHVDLASLRRSPLVGDLIDRKELDVELNGEDLREVAALLGIDPLADIHRLTLGIAFSGQKDRPVSCWVAQLEGDLARLRSLDALARALAEEEGLGAVSVKRRKMAGRDVETAELRSPDPPGGKQELAMARLDAQTVIVGQPEGVADVLEARAGHRAGLGTARALQPMLESLPSGASLWLVASPQRILGMLERFGEDLELPAEMPELSGLALGARVEKDLELFASAWAADDESARTLGDLARGGLALLRLAASAEAKADPEIDQLLRSLHLEIRERELRLDARLPGGLVGKLRAEAGDDARKLRMQVGQKRSVRIPGLRKAKIDDPAVAECRVDAERISLAARRSGRTRVQFERKDGRAGQIELLVEPRWPEACGRRLVVSKGSELTLHVESRSAAEVEQPDLAAVELLPRDRIRLVGKKPGWTVLRVRGEGAAERCYRVEVRP